MRYDAEHKARTRERVLDSAVRTIRREGPGRLAVAGVMQDAGMTHGGFYAHFASRDELIMAAIAEMFGSARDSFERRTEGLPPCDALRTYVRFYLSRGHRDARDSGCPLPVLAGDLPRMAAAARERYSQGVARLTGLLQAQLEALGRPDAPALAASALAEMIGALSLSRAVGDPEQSDLILARSRAAVLARLGVEEKMS